MARSSGAAGVVSGVHAADKAELKTDAPTPKRQAEIVKRNEIYGAQPAEVTYYKVMHSDGKIDWIRERVFKDVNGSVLSTKRNIACTLRKDGKVLLGKFDSSVMK